MKHRYGKVKVFACPACVSRNPQAPPKPHLSFLPPAAAVGRFTNIWSCCIGVSNEVLDCSKKLDLVQVINIMLYFTSSEIKLNKANLCRCGFMRYIFGWILLTNALQLPCSSAALDGAVGRWHQNTGSLCGHISSMVLCSCQLSLEVLSTISHNPGNRIRRRVKKMLYTKEYILLPPELWVGHSAPDMLQLALSPYPTYTWEAPVVHTPPCCL